MKTAFISRSYEHRAQYDAAIAHVVASLRRMNMEGIDFVRRYSFAEGQAREMMAATLQSIQQADVLIAEVSEKVIGVGIEIGYAAALGKPIVYARKLDAPFSTTVGGLATIAIVYDNPQDLEDKLIDALHSLDKETK
ncbi:MAG: nucleoside 2-deoxyribosyltransferase [Anaerolineae bacterium]|nr:nucleoside 2-deoxyribosyltransferase [Anaerolineae bacterium]